MMPHRLGMVLLLLGLLAIGCQTTAVLVQVYKPPESELSDVRYIEVETFNVAETVAKQSGENISGPLKDELRKSKRFIVVDRVGLERVRDFNKARQEGLLELDKSGTEPLRLRAPDAILRGNVVAYRCEGSAALSGARAQDVVHEVVFDPISWSLHSIRGFKQDELIQLEGSVAITYQLLDARTGIIRCSGESIHSQRRLYMRSLATGGEQARMLRELSRKCVEDVANKLVPHKVDELVLFAEGDGAVHEGIQRVKTGDWKNAQAVWESAAGKNPNAHAALYNLGQAHRAHLEADKAVECFRRAVALKPCPLYERALKRESQDSEQERINDIDFASGGELVNHGIAFAREGDWQRAETAWLQALAEQPSDHAALYNLAIVRREQGNLKEAQSLVTRALKLQESNRLYQREFSRLTARLSGDTANTSAAAIVPVSAAVSSSP